MSTEISNYITISHSRKPAQKTKDASAQTHNSKAKQETGSAVLKDVNVSTRAKVLNAISEEIEKMPDIDFTKIAKARANLERILAKTENTARKMLDLDSQFPRIKEDE